MNGFYIRPDDWRERQAYWAEIQAEEDRANEAKEERQQMDKEVDQLWQKVYAEIDKDAFKRNLTDVDVSVIWRLGLASWDTAKNYGGKFPHE